MLFFHMTKLGTLGLSSTSAEKGFFGNHAMWKLNFLPHLSIDLNFRHTSKKIEGGSPKKILEKKNVFPKKYVELRTFDGKYCYFSDFAVFFMFFAFNFYRNTFFRTFLRIWNQHKIMRFLTHCVVHCNKRFATFLSPAGTSLTKLSLGWNNLIISSQGEFGKWRPGWGRGRRQPFFTV